MSVSIGSSPAPEAQVSNLVTVKVQNSAGDQLEAVVGKLMEGVQESAAAVRAYGQTGQNLNIVA